MINEAVFALQEGLASAKEIDNGMKLGCSHPIGPLALADMVGLDVLLAVMEVFYRDFNDPKYRPALLLKEMVAAGHLGRKSGRGFYTLCVSRGAGASRGPCIACATEAIESRQDDRPDRGRPGGGVEQCRQHPHWIRSRASCCITPRCAATTGDREKDLGIWQTWTWSQVADEVRALACGLAAQGFERGMHLAIIGDNRPRLYWSMLAGEALGGVPVPMYQDAPAAEFVYVLNDAGIVFAIAEDQEQVDKLVEAMPQVPTLAHVYYDDPRGLRNYDGVDELRAS